MAFTVKYISNGANSGSVPVDNTAYNSGDTVTVLGNTGGLAQTHANFVYWSTANDDTGTVQGPGSTFTITGNVTLYAQYFSSNGLTGGGITTHYALTYNTVLSASDGLNRANTVLASVENDYNWMSNLFGNVGLPFTLPISLELAGGGYAGAGWGPPIRLQPGNGSSSDLVRYLIVSEVTEMMMDQKANGWGYSYGDGNEGSKGEGLSRFMGFQFLAQKGLDTSIVSKGGSTFFVANDWLSSTRTDFVNYNPDDNKPDATTGCTTLFVYYLYSQLTFTVGDIFNAGAQFLSGVYTNLTGDPGDPFPFFLRLLNNAFPGTNTIGTGPNFDDPWPIGILSFWVDQNTFGRDQVQDIINVQGGVVSNAFWLVLEGFSINAFNALNIAVPTPTGSLLDLGGISVIPTPTTPGGPTPTAPIPHFEDPTNLKAPQRIRFSFDLKFASTSAFPAAGSTNPVTGELVVAATVGGKPLTGASATTLFELIGGENPYFLNTDPSNQAALFYFSQDLRVFSVNAGDTPLAGAPAFTTDPYGSIQSFLGHLNSTAPYTSFPGATDPLNQLPGQTGYETADTSVTALNGQGKQNYNFAIARVRLRGAAGAQAQNTRVFFRLFVAQSADTDFQPSTTYRSQLGTSGPDANLPVFPLPSDSGLTDPSGQSLQTIPFFATSAAGTHDYDGTVANSNIQSPTIPNPGDEVCAYFGCYLDVFNNSNNSKFGGTHHCIVAQIAYDGLPIPTTTPNGIVPTPANWDQLAQRNLQITTSENPKSRATHVIPQAFDLRPSKPLLPTPGFLLDQPDELMIDWNNVPPGSTATFYWPHLNAADVIGLAGKSYASHLLSAADAKTIQCTVTRGVTYVPIPVAFGGSYAGLLTIDLPDSVKKGQEFNVIIRRVSTRRPPPPPPIIRVHSRKAVVATDSEPTGNDGGADTGPDLDTTPVIPPGPPHRGLYTTNWRQISGAFQVRIPVTTADVMLPIEENTLAVLKWRLTQMPPAYRWVPVLERYVALIAARVDGLPGGNSANVPPSLNGYQGAGKPGHHCPGVHHHTGKVAGLIFDRFGDFEGFLLRLESGEERLFKAGEPNVEKLIQLAWEERWLITVITHLSQPEWPASIIVKRSAYVE